MAWCLINHRDDFILYRGAGIVNRYWKDAEGSVPCRVLNFSLSYHVLMGCGTCKHSFEKWTAKVVGGQSDN